MLFPPITSQLNRCDPITEDLLFYSASLEGVGQTLDYVKLRKTDGSAPVWLLTSGGRAIKDASLTHAKCAELSYTTEPFSFGCRFRIVGSPTNSEYTDIIAKASYSSESVNNGYSMTLIPPNDGFPTTISASVFSNNAYTDYRLSTTFNWVANSEYFLIHTSDGGSTPNRKLYVNGALNATRTSNAPGACTADFRIGSSSATISTYPYETFFWRRCVTADEIARLSAEQKYRLITPRQYRRFFIPTPSAFNPALAGAGNTITVGLL